MVLVMRKPNKNGEMYDVKRKKKMEIMIKVFLSKFLFVTFGGENKYGYKLGKNGLTLKCEVNISDT